MITFDFERVDNILVCIFTIGKDADNEKLIERLQEDVFLSTRRCFDQQSKTIGDRADVETVMSALTEDDNVFYLAACCGLPEDNSDYSQHFDWVKIEQEGNTLCFKLSFKAFYDAGTVSITCSLYDCMEF